MPSQGGSTRWCPTPEQLMILEEMYRGGLRTPNASQIQQITAHLSYYGRIEGKNVFYWFQNHKARDRQKLRRRLCMSHHLLSCAHHYYAAAAAGNHHHLPQYCLDQALVSPTTTTTSPYYYPFAAPPRFHYQGGVLGPEALGRPDYSLGKLDNFGVVDDASTPASTVDVSSSGYELAAMDGGTVSVSSMSVAVAPQSPAGCRPLKTLDLFPGGLKDEQHDLAK